MAQVHQLIQSFNAGELSPLLGARFGVEKVASGCRLLRNFLLHVHGPVFRRPGMEFLGAAATTLPASEVLGGGSSGGASRLAGFNFSTTTSAMLEFHPSGLRVWQNGALVELLYPVPLPWTSAEAFEVQFVQVNDVCYLTHPNHPPRKLTRYADNNWGVVEVPWKWPAMGDASASITDQAPAVSILLLAPQPQSYSAEFTVSVGPVNVAIASPHLGAQSKSLALEYDLGSGFAAVDGRVWTTSPPAAISYGHPFGGSRTARLRYTGPFSTGSATATYSGGGPTILQFSGPLEVTVPAGEWQVVATCSQDVAGDSLAVEFWNGAAWVNLHTFALGVGCVLTFRGATLSVDTLVRLVEGGDFFENGSTARIERLVFSETLDVTIAVSHVSGLNRTMTASAPIFLPAHVGSYWQISHRREKAFVEIISGTSGTVAAATSAELRVAGGWQVLTYGTWKTTLYLERKTGVAWETVRSWSSAKDANFVVDGIEDQAIQMRIRVDAGTSATATGAPDGPRFVLYALDAELAGLVKVTGIGTLAANGKSTTATVDIISALHATTATLLWEEGAWSGVRGYPRSVAIHEERLWYGGTRAEPMRLWGSVVADYEDFRRSTLDDAGLSFTPSASSSNGIQWMISKERELVFGTKGDEWTLGTESGPITPVNVLVQRRSAYGSEFQRARLISEVIVFVQRGGLKLREIAPRAETEPWAAVDLTVLAEHIARPGIVQFAVQSAPFAILWAVTSDGLLLAMTFETEQNVFGWQQHPTDGLVESVAVIQGAEMDEVWCSVLRGTNRNIERLDPLVFAREFDSRGRLMYLDAAVRFEDPSSIDPDFVGPVPPVGPVLEGLFHLEGREVGVALDGADFGTFTVVAGAIDLGRVARTAIVGLPFTSELQPMRMDIPLRDGTAQGRQFRVSRVAIHVEDSLGGEIAESSTGRFEALNYRRVADPMDTAPPLYSGEIEKTIASNARSGIDVIIKTSAPVPLNITFIVAKGDIYGE